MALSISEIKLLLDAGEIQPNLNDVVASGVVPRSDGVQTVYTFHFGWDIAKSYACDQLWGAFNAQLMGFVEDTYKDPDKRNCVLDELQLEDHHWEWFKKSCHMGSAEYIWFFIFADGQPQAACVIYHPKESAFSQSNIFYIEFVAVAPWNRKNPMHSRRFNGLGSCIIKHATEFAMKRLALTPGFSLHSLPKAAGFYEKIGMIPFADQNKEALSYYEMPAAKLGDFLRSA